MWGVTSTRLQNMRLLACPPPKEKCREIGTNSYRREGSIPSERNPETGGESSTHQATEKIPTLKQRGKAETHCHQKAHP